MVDAPSFSILNSGRDTPRQRMHEVIRPAAVALLKSNAFRLLSKMGHSDLGPVAEDVWILNQNVWFATKHRDLIFTFSCRNCAQVFRVLPCLIKRSWSPTLWIATPRHTTIIQLATQIDSEFALELRNHFCPRLKAVF